MIALLLALGCGGGSQETLQVVPTDAGLAECEVCGMVVAEQPAPRGQVLHRDGHRTFTCSLGDLRAYAQAPSPRGRPVAVWVEALPRGFDPDANPTEPFPWVPAEDAHFVTGSTRPMVMGLPLLSFADASAARSAAEAYGTTPVTWTALIDAPFHELPPAAAPGE